MAPSSLAMITATFGSLMVASRTYALQVVAPSEGVTVVAQTPVEVEWIGAADDARFDIDLYFEGSFSFLFEDEDDCGFFIASLCAEGSAGCAAENGDEVVMPEPVISGDEYRLRITQVGTDKSSCSAGFQLVSSVDSVTPSINILSPTINSVALAGEEYTVEFEYDNGLGSSVGRFQIDLYSVDGDGDCGAWLTSICDKPDRGCRDTQGDYNVEIPAWTSSGMHSIRVGVFGEESVFACSEPFEVWSLSDSLWA